MRISLNLASRPFADIGPAIRQLRFAIGALAVVAIALGVGLHFMQNQANEARARERSIDTSIARIDHERQTYQTMMRQPQNAAVLDQAEALNKLIDEKAFSWTLAMEDLEMVLPGGVQVTTLEPNVDRKTGQITVRLRVTGPRDKAVELVQNLEHSRHFVQPRIIGESAESTNTAGAALEPVSATNRVNFDVLADYVPPAPEEHRATEKKTEEHRAQAAATPRTHSEAFRGGPGLRRPPRTGGTRHATPAKPNPGAPR